MLKADLRLKHIHQRKSISEAKRQYASSLIFHQLLPVLDGVHVVGMYVGLKHEVDTKGLLEWCWSQGKRVAIPKVTPQGLVFVEVKDLTHTRRVGKLGLIEPIDSTPIDEPIELMLVPMLAFDDQAYRLGYGGGYYDRYLKTYEGLSVGLCFDFGHEANLPREAHDVPCDVICTNKRWIEGKLGIMKTIGVST
jgi:5-formyltetrahydrofolate cyclo-ligase